MRIEQGALVWVDNDFWNFFFSHPLKYFVNQDDVTYFSFQTDDPFLGEIDDYILVDFGFALSEQEVDRFSLVEDLTELFKQPTKYFHFTASNSQRTICFAEELKDLGIEPNKYPRKANIYQLQIEDRNVVILVPDMSDSFPEMVLTRILLDKGERYQDEHFIVLSELHRTFNQRLIGLRPAMPARSIPVSPLPPYVEQMTLN